MPCEREKGVNDKVFIFNLALFNDAIGHNRIILDYIKELEKPNSS